MRVLQLSPFPIPDAPTTGGQVRICELAKAYAAAGWQLDRIVVHDRTPQAAGPRDIALGWWDRQRRQHIGRPKGISNLRHVWAWRSDRSAQAMLGRLLKGGLPRYDVIQCEHPWDFDLAWRLRASGACPTAQLVYSAHNVEADLHAASWQGNGQWTSAAMRLVDAIRSHEQDVARRADLCWAVSEADASFLRQAGAREVHVLPNGVHVLAAPQPQQEFVGTPYGLFIASDHVPNVAGFRQWLAAPLERHVPPGTAIVLAGSIGRALHRLPEFAPDFAASRLLDLGIVDRARLDQLIHHAHGLILPIGSGGGTSLKTAEALISGRPVITTEAGLRGFEPFASHPQVSLAAAPAEFGECLRRTLVADRQAPANDAGRQRLTWAHALAPLPQVLSIRRDSPET